MDYFRMQVSALYAESLLALPDFLYDREQIIHAATARRPWESEFFFGEHNLTSFVRRIFGRYASFIYICLIACTLAIVLARAFGSYSRLFVLLLSCPWLVVVLIEYLIYHFQYQADFNSTWRPATYDWYNVIEYGPQLEYEEGSSLEDDRFDPFIEEMRDEHTYFLYGFIEIWYMINYVLLMSMIHKFRIYLFFLELMICCTSILLVFLLFLHFIKYIWDYTI